MLQKLLFVFLLFTTVFSSAGAPLSGIEALVDSLDIALDMLPHSIEERSAKCHNLAETRLEARGEERVKYSEQLAKLYIVTDVDSAMIYLQMARADAQALGDGDAVRRINMQIFALMPTRGMTKEGVDFFEALDYDALPQELRRDYWRCAAELYNSARAPYPEGAIKNRYRLKTLAAIDSMRTYYPHNSNLSQYLLGVSHLLAGDNTIAVANFLEAIPNLANYPELTDFAMKSVAEYYSGRPEYNNVYLSYVLRRAVSSLKSGVIRPELLAQVGSELLKIGEDDIARRCIQLALETSDNSYRGPFASFDRAPYMRYLYDNTASIRQLHVAYAVFASLTVLIFVLLYLRLRVRLRLKSEELVQANATTESVRQESKLTNQSVITLAFVALEVLNDYNLHVARKLKAGQVKDLFAEVESGKYIQKQNDKYFEVFDSTFLANFPNFLAGLNRLLQPDKQLSLLPGDRLSPELRIAAFMRLGVTDSARLSQALGLSLNTIYTYRNRLKGRALDRDKFEENVAKVV